MRLAGESPSASGRASNSRVSQLFLQPMRRSMLCLNPAVDHFLWESAKHRQPTLDERRALNHKEHNVACRFNCTVMLVQTY